MNFKFLVQQIESTHILLNQAAVKAVNIHLTLRNWLIGFYIVEFEQKGDNRSAYGTKLLHHLSENLNQKRLLNINERELRRFRSFYQIYANFGNVFSKEAIRGTVSPELAINIKRGTLSPETVSSQTQIAVERLLTSLSFSHFIELIEVDDALKRNFYEVECAKGQWSVRELRRQINTLYFERSGLSGNPAQMSIKTQSEAEQQNTSDFIKSHFAFEFLGINGKTIIEESDLERALLDHFQDFLLEMGRGFCLEARQKRILIGDEYFFIDMVLYHRILKCHVLIELKSDKFNHAHISQLNTYINYYKKEIKENSDNPPIGILMVADKNNPLVEYALAGLDNQVFVSRYLLQLPDKKQLQDFIASEIKLL
ncbi:MAG: PDDEXK nuclease domain-containing protein [Bacteroidota bacterium]